MTNLNLNIDYRTAIGNAFIRRRYHLLVLTQMTAGFRLRLLADLGIGVERP